MEEFKDQADGRLSPTFPLKDFEQIVYEISRDQPGEQAYNTYRQCLDEIALDDSGDETIAIKRSLLHQESGNIEHQRGDYEQSLLSYALARAELDGHDAIRSFILEVNEGHMVMCDMRNPVAAITPYEAAASIFEARFCDGDIKQPPQPDLFNSYMGVLGHLAIAYGITGRTDEMREVSRKIADYDALSPAIFGLLSEEEDFGWGPLFGRSEDEAKICRAAKELLSEEIPSTIPPNRDYAHQFKRIKELEEQVDTETFLSDMPEQRAFILQSIYRRFLFATDSQEHLPYINKALAIAKKYNFLVAKVNIYATLGTNQAERKEPPSKQLQTSRRAFLAMIQCLEAGIDTETAQTIKVATGLIIRLANRKDFVGIERVHRKLAEYDIKLQRTAPGAQNPTLN